MKTKTLVAVLVGMVAACPSWRNDVVVSAQTQSQLNADADRELRSTEAEMAQVLQSLTRKASGHADAMAKLERAQAAWVAYRDAHIEAVWPSKTPVPSYASVHPTCVSKERTRLTRDRIRELRLMLTAKEGEVCFGSWPE